MTFLAPGFFFASLAVAAAVAALHFIVTRQPRAGILPTARFVPDLPATATARTARPTDLLLMLLRVLLVLAAGAGLARPVLKPSRVAEARVILVDASRSVGNVAELRDSAKAVYREGDAMIIFDSSARFMNGNGAASIAALVPSGRSGNLSAALISAMRAGSTLRDVADSLELVVVSPFGAEEIDAATDSIRGLWPGRARLVRAGAVANSLKSVRLPLEIRAAATDPLVITAALARRYPDADAVIWRNELGGEDSASVIGAGRALVEWPFASRPRGTVQRSERDTIGGVLSGNAVVIAGFERRWMFAPDSLRDGQVRDGQVRDGQVRDGQVIARWIDGEPAAVEWPAGDGCVRSVAVPVPSAGDLPIRDDFVRFVAAIAGPCSAHRKFEPMGAMAIASLTGMGGMAPRKGFSLRGDAHSWLAPWFLGLALLAAVTEMFLRRRSGGARVQANPAQRVSTS